MERFTRPIGLKLQEADFNRLQILADRDGKRLGEWCRERLLAALDQPVASPIEQVLLAEIAATQNITISLLYAYARDGQLPEAKVRETLDRARREKYAQAAELLRQAGSVPWLAPAISDKSARHSL
jgi:hypothetical protein